MGSLKIITLLLSLSLLCSNLYAQYNAGTVIYNQNSTTNLTSISKNYIVDDFDGDFNADIIMVKRNVGNFNTLTWYKGNGNGNFTPQANIMSVNNIYYNNEIFYTDMNGDGIKDIVFQNNDTGFVILFNDGFGNIFDQISNTSATGNLVGADLKEIADVDGDGDMDGIFFAKTDSMTWWNQHLGYSLIGYNNGTGTFSNYNYLDNDVFLIYYQVETGDIDGDGNLDIICSGEKSLFDGDIVIGLPRFFAPFLNVYRNTGLNNYTPKEEIELAVVSIDSRMLFINTKVQDINSDGNNELLIEYYFTDNCLDQIHALDCENFNQFQVLDYLPQNEEFVTLELYNSWLHGYYFPDFPYYDSQNLYENAFQTQSGHQNTDNNLDILSVNVPQGKLHWYNGDGNGGFNNGQVVNFNNQYSSIQPTLKVSDIDNDTDLDIFVLLNDDTSSTLTVFKNLALTPACSSVLDLGNTSLTDGTYQAGTTLISAGDVVNGNNNVVLKAGSTIKLKSGFKVPANSSLKVRISSCN